MAEQAKVVADGLETTKDRKGPRSYWGWLAAGTMIGFGLSFLLFGAEPIPPASTEAQTPLALNEEQPARGVGEVVPGFKDGLVAVTSADGQTMDLTFWPVAGAEFDRDMPLGTFTTREQVRFDASGRRVAAMHFVPGEAFSGLVVGVPASMRLVDIDVTGYAWHDSTPGLLAYTTIEGRVLWIWRFDLGFTEPEVLTSHATLDGGLVAHGDWGYAVQNADMTEVTVLSPAGVIEAVYPGRLLTSSNDGRLVIKDRTISIHQGEVTMVNLEERFGVVGEAKTAEFSPDGRMLAIVDDMGLLVFPVSGGDNVVRTEPNTGVTQIAWTSDSRFVMVPLVRGLGIIDTRNGDIHSVFSDRTVFAAAVLPLATS